MKDTTATSNNSVREIKFRAWSPKWRKMIYHGDDGYEIDVLANTVWRDLSRDETVYLMEYIGISDKNGKEIYEGDFLDCCKKRNNEITRILIKDIRHLPSEIYSSNLKYIHVVGNIYKNKYLLNDK